MASLSEVNVRGEPPTRRALVVLGMHRSGTSAMTRTLSLLGAALPKNLMKIQPDNPSGFWESASVQDLNDEILQSLDSEWDDIFAFRPRQYLSNFDRFYLGRASELLEQEFGNSQLIVIKDPRVSILAAFWERALREAGFATSYVVMVRNPLEVAESLRDRNAFPREKSLLLWASYMLALERDTREQERIFIAYEELIDDWRAVRRRIEESTAIPFPRDTAAGANEIDRFLNRKLRHHDANGEALLSSPDVPDHVKRLYRIFTEACRGGGIDRGVLDEVHAKLADIDAMIGPVVADLRARTTALAGEVSALSNQLHMEREQRESEADEAASTADDLRRQLEEVTNRIQNVELEREQALALSRSKDEEIAETVRNKDAELAELVSLKEAELAQLVRLKDAELAELVSLKEAELAQLVRLKDAELAELVRLKDAELAELVRLKDAEFAELVRLKDAELAELAGLRDEAIANLMIRISDADHACASLEARLAAADSTLEATNEAFAGSLAKVEGERDAARSKLAEQSQELATITELLHEKERHSEAARENLEWLLAVQQQIAKIPRRWTLISESSRRQREFRELKRAGLFDADAYLQQYPDVAAAGVDPLDHYLRCGIHEGRIRNR